MQASAAPGDAEGRPAVRGHDETARRQEGRSELQGESMRSARRATAVLALWSRGPAAMVHL